MSQRVIRTIDAIIGRLEHLTVKFPAAIDALCDQRRKIDGWPAGADNPTKVKTKAELTPTEAAYAHREHIDLLMTNMHDELNAVAKIVANLAQDCDRYIGHQLEPAPRCDGGSTRLGAIEWGRPDCTNVPEAGRTMCSRCRKAEDRWLADHGYRRTIGQGES